MVNNFLGRIGEIGLFTSFIALASQNGLEDRNADVNRLNGDDPPHQIEIS